MPNRYIAPLTPLSGGLSDRITKHLQLTFGNKKRRPQRVAVSLGGRIKRRNLRQHAEERADDAHDHGGHDQHHGVDLL
ncbi:MAG: hypothetical protein UE003_03130, partial [Collinsella sp.]|nr:hypothetical protein [Collinsella sp.]